MSFKLKSLFIIFCLLLFAQSLYSESSSFLDYLSRWKDENNKLINELINSTDDINSTIFDIVRDIPRHDFVSPAYRTLAYKDISLPSINDAILPSPSDCIKAIKMLSPSSSDKILIIGKNCGYTAAILSKMVDEVYLIEKTDSIKDYEKIFKKLEIENIYISEEKDKKIFNKIMTFDKILIHGALSSISEELTEKLGVQGSITFILCKNDDFQQIISMKRSILGDSIICGGSCYFPQFE